MKKKIICGGVFLLCFILVMVLVVTNSISGFDNLVYNSIISLRSNGFDNFFKAITIFGNASTVIIIAFILFLRLDKKNKIVLGSNLIYTVGFNQVIKRIIRRPRPSHLRLIKESGFSFPSGHSMISICVYGMIIYYVLKNVSNKKLKYLLTILLSLLIILIGMSRIYVGVHYPSDVLGGYLLSLAIIIINTSLINYFYGGKNNGKDGYK